MRNYNRKQSCRLWWMAHSVGVHDNTKHKVGSVTCRDSLDFNILWTMLTQGHPRRIKGLNSVIYKQMHVKTFHINKHQTQIDEELVHSIMPLLKKIYKHAHTLTQSQLHHHTLGHDWTHIAQYTVTKFEFWVHSTQTQSMQVFTQQWDWGTCLSLHSIQSPF